MSETENNEKTSDKTYWPNGKVREEVYSDSKNFEKKTYYENGQSESVWNEIRNNDNKIIYLNQQEFTAEGVMTKSVYVNADERRSNIESVTNNEQGIIQKKEHYFNVDNYQVNSDVTEYTPQGNIKTHTALEYSNEGRTVSSNKTERYYYNSNNNGEKEVLTQKISFEMEISPV